MTLAVRTRRDVRLWPKADIPSCTAHVRFRLNSGHRFLREFAFAVGADSFGARISSSVR